MKSYVYTRTGDQGETSLVGGQRVPKTHARLEAYGTVDELNSQVGLLLSYIEDAADRDFLTDVQRTLFIVGSSLATDTTRRELSENSIVHQEHIEALEKEIDRVDEGLPRLKAFVLPAGCRAACVAHVCRTVCRRAERCILHMQESCPVAPLLIAYINRLSDYFFVLARKLNNESEIGEIFWSRK